MQSSRNDTCQPPSRILFDHVPKTGGTALHALLRAKLGADRCSPLITGSLADARAEFDRYACVSGHFFFQPHTRLDDLWAVTLLREPVSRILSHLAYARHDIMPSGDAFSQRTRELDLPRYIESDDPDVVRTISNTMVAHFAPLAWDGIEPLSGDASLRLAKLAMERFELVGLTERMAETADLLCWHLGLEPAAEIPRLNVGSSRVSAADLPGSTRRRLAALNELDRELYEHARDLHGACRRKALFAGAGPLPRPLHPAPEVAPHVGGKVDFGTRQAEIGSVELHGQSGLGPRLLSGEIATIRIGFHAREDLQDLTVGLRITDDRGRLVFATNTRGYGYVLRAREGVDGSVAFVFRADLGMGQYRVSASVHPGATHLPHCYHWIDDAATFDVVGNAGWHFDGWAKLRPELAFEGVEREDLPGAQATAVQHLARLAPAVTDFHARIVALSAPASIATGEWCSLPVEVRNIGADSWPATGERSVRMAYHWLAATGDVVVFDGERTLLDRDLAPQEAVRAWAYVRGPEQPGDYVLRVCVLQEGVGWLDTDPADVLDLAVTVTA